MFDKITKYIGSKSPKELLIAIIVILIGIWVMDQWIFPKLKETIKKITPPKPNDGSTMANISEDRKTYLKTLAENLLAGYSCFFCWTGTTIGYIDNALQLNDSEVILLNKYYGTLGENTLYFDTDNEWLPETESDDRLLAKLIELNVRYK